MPKIDQPPADEPAFFSPQIVSARRFFFDLNPPANAPFAVVCGGRETCAANYKVSRATMPFTSIEFVAGGGGTVELAGQVEELHPGTVFIYGPGVPHVIRAGGRSRNQPLIKYFVGFVGRRVPSLLSQCQMPPGTVRRSLRPDAVVSLLDDLLAAASRHSPRGPAICALILEQLLLELADASVPTGAFESRSFLTYQRCREFIARHHRQLSTMRDVADACDINVSYLCRLFQRYDQQRPYEYLTRLKMAVAAELLHDPTKLVKEVASELGFPDPFHLSRAFKKIYGLSPKQLRDHRSS